MTKIHKSPELIYPFKRKVVRFNEWQVWGTCPYNCEAVVGIGVHTPLSRHRDKHLCQRQESDVGIGALLDFVFARLFIIFKDSSVYHYDFSLSQNSLAFMGEPLRNYGVKT